jgi:hypothetical protein
MELPYTVLNDRQYNMDCLKYVHFVAYMILMRLRTDSPVRYTVSVCVHLSYYIAWIVRKGRIIVSVVVT